LGIPHDRITGDTHLAGVLALARFLV